jgi:hypothetical protein
MPWLLVGYMFLFIHRPFEVWPLLGDLHVERVYMALTLLAWAVSPKKRWLPNPQHAAYCLFALAVVGCWVVSPWMEQGQLVVENYFKIVVFYLLLVTTIGDERGLKIITAGFLAVMGVYLLHSLREYVGGRFTYRMGIARMIGVDSSLGDPNSFGNTILFALPFVPALWTVYRSPAVRVALAGYAGLSVLCILLTGSRSSFLGLLMWGVFAALRSRHRFLWLAALVVFAPAAFVALPESLQTRFETIINPDVGPANAKESGEGRLLGFVTGMELWAANPLTGIGPGAWRPATKSIVESHNLYGQLLGETGSAGGIAFVAILVCFWLNLRRVKRVARCYPEWQNDLVIQIPRAVGVSIMLMLLEGNFGHNLFRHNWLWFGGFLVIARYCLERRLLVEAEAEEAVADEPIEAEPEPLPAGWRLDPAHA